MMSSNCSGQVLRYSREELLSLRSAPSCQKTSPPTVPDFVPLQEKNGMVEGKERKVEPLMRDRSRYTQSARPSQLYTRKRRGEEAATAENVRERELTNRGGYGLEQTNTIRPRNRPFDIDYYFSFQDDIELILKLYKNLEEFKAYLKLASISVSCVEKLVTILHKVLACDIQRESLLKILQVVCTSRFLNLHLQTYIDHLQKCSRNEVFRQDIVEAVQKMLDLLSNICHRLPSERMKVYLLLNYIKSQDKLATVIIISPVVGKHFEEVLAQSQKPITAQRTALAKTDTGNEDDKTPSEDFLDIPVFPDGRDLDFSKIPFLRPSKTVGAFKDAHHYLDVHFRLLREDFLRPLRNGIRNVKAEDASGLHPTNIDVRLYQNVRIIGMTPGDTLDYVIQFDIKPFRKVRWQSSKRLIFGSLVCLSDDHFDTVFFAVITKRDVEKLEDGIIQVCFETQTGEVAGLSPDSIFIMVESVSYFEANRHVLEGLKELKNMVPMSRYLVECHKEVSPPKYLTASGNIVTMNLTALIGPASQANAEKVPVTDFSAWPSDTNWELNASQLESVKMALTKELAIIQGPPGTGKTYVGLKIVQVLLDNARVWNVDSNTKPILVVCYTNHALDQFLEGILKFCPEGIVRVGSRSQSEALSPFSISKRRENVKDSRDTKARNLSSSMYECHERMKEIAKGIRKTKSRLTKIFSDILKAEDLESHILPHHYQSLTSKSTIMRVSLMAVWLCGGMTVGNEDCDSETDRYDHLVQKVTSQILQEKTVFGHGDVLDDIYSEDLPIRAQMYRLWLKKTKARLAREVKEAKDVDLDPKQLEEWLEAAEVEILPDHILQPDMDKSLFEAITCREDLPHHIYAPYFIRFWLGIDEISRNYEDLEYVLNELLEAQQVNINRDSDEIVDSSVDEWNSPPTFSTCYDQVEQNAASQRHAEMREISVDTKELNIDEEAEFLQNQRLLDEDENDDVIPQMFADDESAKGISDQSDSEWVVPRKQRRRHFRKILYLAKTLTPMSDEEAAMIIDVWNVSLDTRTRVRLYMSWLQKYRKHLTNEIKDLADRYATESRILSDLRLERDGLILKNSKIIGMTSAASARCRRLLATVGCPIVVIEEAAEVLEAHVVTTLSSSCQHLILIGDHQQLRPSPTVYELCRDYHLDLSLFERLVNNDLPHSTLTTQHRMRPEVAHLVRHVYPDLQDHPKTDGRPHVRGMKHDVFFFHHEVEEDNDMDGKSKSNDYEAQLCLALCCHLLHQGYSKDSITILVAYSGQILAIRKHLMADKQLYSGVRVTSIDNYQGEENDIIILSLVRSNKEGKVGFLQTDNRVCVALSRAKIGLYALGNFRILSAKSQLWQTIIATATEHGQFGRNLVICCNNHPDREILVASAEDFQKSPEGGCMLPCAAKLKCGHTCRLFCHGYDKNHEEYRCMESCPKVLCDLGHQCPHKCCDPCQKCQRILSKVVPGCSHTISIACSTTPDQTMCRERCQQILSCGHRCSGKCGTCCRLSKHECSEKVERLWPCGHTNITRCDVVPKENSCPHKCEATLKCGHACPGSCCKCFGGTAHEDCIEKCLTLLPGCGHRCEDRCGDPCSPCQRKCKVVCKHAKCGQSCDFPCPPCLKHCPFGCPHRPCLAKCSNPCKPCMKRCTKRLKCKHKCAGKCKETCFCYGCEREYFVSWPPNAGQTRMPGRFENMMKLPRCGHIFTTSSLDEYVEEKIKAFPYETSLPCPACKTVFYAWDTWRYLQRLTLHQENLRKTKEFNLHFVTDWCSATY